MNIPELSTAMASVELSNKVGVAVLSKALDNSEAIGDEMLDMMNQSMELSVNPAVGGFFDMSV